MILYFVDGASDFTSSVELQLNSTTMYGCEELEDWTKVSPYPCPEEQVIPSSALEELTDFVKISK